MIEPYRRQRITWKPLPVASQLFQFNIYGSLLSVSQQIVILLSHKTSGRYEVCVFTPQGCGGTERPF